MTKKKDDLKGKEKVTDRAKVGVQSVKVYFSSALIVIGVSILGSLLSNSFSSVAIDTSKTVLENVISLDGVLFGFTAAVISIFYFKAANQLKNSPIIAVFVVTAFLSYLISIFMSFCFLMAGEHRSGIFLPVFVTLVGALCSSVYIILVTIEKEMTK